MTEEEITEIQALDAEQSDIVDKRGQAIEIEWVAELNWMRVIFSFLKRISSAGKSRGIEWVQLMKPPPAH